MVRLSLFKRAEAVEAHGDVVEVEDHLVRQVELAGLVHPPVRGRAVPVLAQVLALGVEAGALAFDLEGGDHAFAPLASGVSAARPGGLAFGGHSSAGRSADCQPRAPAPAAAEASSSVAAARRARSLRQRPTTPSGR
jgi:hypothetical protein